VSEKVERVALQDDMRTLVYGKANCPFCAAAKDELDIRGVQYEYIDLEEIGKTAAEVTGRKVKSVPQIYVEGQYVGGYDEMMEYFNKPITTETDECRACEG
jgi:glutaredoxin